MSVVVPVVVPFTRMVAPGRGAPVSSDTVPRNLNILSKALTAPKIRKTTTKKVCVKFLTHNRLGLLKILIRYQVAFGITFE